MDPVMVDTLKHIVKKDLKKEVAEMRNSEEGCSEKCRVSNEILRLDNQRSAPIVDNVLQFKWCDTCVQRQPGAVNICNSGCGFKFFKSTLPNLK